MVRHRFAPVPAGYWAGMPETGNAQVGAGQKAKAAADLEEQGETKQDQVLQREGVETALMDSDRSDAGEHIDGVESAEEPVDPEESQDPEEDVS